MDVPSGIGKGREVSGGGKLRRGRERRKTRTSFPDDGLAELVLLEVDPERTVVLLDETHLLQPLDGSVHRLRPDLALARVLVKVHVQPRVLLLVLFDRQLPPHAPVLERLLVAVLHALEERARGVVNRRISVGVLINLDVDIEQVLNGVFLESLLVAVLLEADGDETELLSPITKVVERDDLPAARTV